MAGYREFQTGEVLTAANVDDFLAKQAVQKYADAAARDAALGTAVAEGNALRQGMVAYLDDTNELLKYDGSAWAGVIAGIGSNVVQTVKTDTFSTSSTAYDDVSGLAVTITPSAATSKVLVSVVCPVGGPTNNAVFLTVTDSANNPIFSPDSPGVRTQAFTRVVHSDDSDVRPQSFSFLHSPSVDTAFTYKVRMRVTGGTGHVNRGNSDPDTSSIARTVASITAIEVSA